MATNIEMPPCHDLSPVHPAALPPFISSFPSAQHRQDRCARKATTTAAVHTADSTEQNVVDLFRQSAKDNVTKIGAARSKSTATAKASTDGSALLRRQLAGAQRHDGVRKATFRARAVDHDHDHAFKANLRPRSPLNQEGRRSLRSINPPASPSPTATTLSSDHDSTVTDIPSSHSRSDVKARTPFLRGIKVPRSHSEVARGVPSDSTFTADDDFYADTSLRRMALIPLQGIHLRYSLDIQQKAAALIDIFPPDLERESSSLCAVMRHIMLHTVQGTDIIITDAAKLLAAETSDLVGALRRAWLNRQFTNLPAWRTIEGYRRSLAGATAAAGTSSPRTRGTNRRPSGNAKRSASTERLFSETETALSPHDRNGNKRGTDHVSKRRARHTDGSSTDTRTVRFSFDNLCRHEGDHHSDSSSSEARSTASGHTEHMGAPSGGKEIDRDVDRSSPPHRSPPRETPSQLISQELACARPPSSCATRASRNRNRGGRRNSGSDKGDRRISRNVFRLFYHPILYSLNTPASS